MLAINDSNPLYKSGDREIDSCESLVNNCPYGMYRTDFDGYFSSVNPAYAKLFGLETPEEFFEYIQSQNCQLYTDLDLRRDIYNKLRKEDHLSHIVYQIFKVDGTTQWVSENCVTVRDRYGSIIAFEGYVEPLAKPSYTEQINLVPEVRFRAIFDQIENIAVQGYDQRRRVIYWNNASTQLYGYSQEEAMGSLLEELIIPNHLRDETINAHKRWLNFNQPIPSGEITLKNKEGSSIPVYSSHVMLVNCNGEHEMYCIDVELTEIKKVERALRIAKDHAERASQAKTAFLSTMTHELRTPLNAIIGFSEVMEQKLFGDLGHPRYQEYVNDIHRSGSHLLGVINDILDLSMIEAGELNLIPTNVNIRSAIAHSIQIAQRKAISTGISLQTNVPKDFPSIKIDERSIKQIFLNLLSNAIKFTGSQGIVNITAHYSDDDGFLIEIEDNGIGMSVSEIEVALRPFAQVDNTLERKYEGTGLGLPLSRSLTVINGGTLKLLSKPGIGTNAILHFPAEKAVMEEKS
ncbi:PAS domain-containing sensor histidine kinase [Kiloniella sp.]|uniref:PAS domain-containing sensor histidine kinase n=1 Tax=Kiloniella sp. TaxID=1938587 RepID=UPI003B02732D